MNLRGASLLATLCLASATHGADPTAPAESLIRKFRKDAGVAFKECPDESCITHALGPCTPAHLTKKISTIEGTPAVFDHFVVKLAAGCRLVTFYDTGAAAKSESRSVPRSRRRRATRRRAAPRARFSSPLAPANSHTAATETFRSVAARMRG